MDGGSVLESEQYERDLAVECSRQSRGVQWWQLLGAATSLEFEHNRSE